jgi:hypothetical protein
MVTRRLRIAAAFFAVACSSHASAQPTAQCLTGLVGTWEGPGRVAGRDILMRQHWSRSLQNAFIELSMTHLASADSTTVVFSGRGFYRPHGDSISGTWLDARGVISELRGTCRDGTLRVEWTGSQESGDTEYRGSETPR